MLLRASLQNILCVTYCGAGCPEYLQLMTLHLQPRLYCLYDAVVRIFLTVLRPKSVQLQRSQLWTRHELTEVLELISESACRFSMIGTTMTRLRKAIAVGS